MGRDASGAGAAPEYLLWRHELADGKTTTLYAVRHPRPATRTRVVHFPTVERLDEWCAAHEVDEAIIGGFFLRDPYRPLGELWIDGRQVPGDAIPAPYAARRACVLATGTDVRLLPRDEAPDSPAGTFSRPARCSSTAARSSSTWRPTAKGSRPARASSTPTSPTDVIRAPRSEWPRTS